MNRSNATIRLTWTAIRRRSTAPLQREQRVEATVEARCSLIQLTAQQAVMAYGKMPAGSAWSCRLKLPRTEHGLPDVQAGGDVEIRLDREGQWRTYRVESVSGDTHTILGLGRA